MNPGGPNIHEARERVQRMLYVASGFGAIVFGALLTFQQGKVLGQLAELNTIFGLVAIVFGILLPASLVIVAWFIPMRGLNVYAGVIVVGFVVVQFLWVPFLAAERTSSEPWLQGINAVPATIAAVLWRHAYVWGYALLQGPLVASVQYLSMGERLNEAVLNGLGAVLFSGILIAVALALVEAASQQDRTAAKARALASIEASKRTHQREQTRINALVHDSIMSVLLIAGREDHSPRVAAQAKEALSSIATLTRGEDENRDYPPAAVIAALRAAVSHQSPDVAFWHSQVGTQSVPAPVVEAFSEAITEAVRNSLLHSVRADDDFVHRVVTVNLTSDTLRVAIQDTGRGFDTKDIAERRLGIRVSIFERMQLLEGGTATVDSKPGKGTTVTLTWVRPR